jgi:cytochrome bd-type quinol oxidase subunit 1
MFVFYGKVRFYHHLFVILTIGLNFNVLPLFYIVLADNQFKTFLLNRDYYNMIKLFFAFH